MFGIFITVFRLALFLILASLMVSFISSNASDVTIGLFPLPFEVELPVYGLGLLMLFGGLVAGGLLVSVGHIGHHLRLKHERQKLLKKIAAMENEMAALRLERSLHAPSSPYGAAPMVLPPKAGTYGA